MQRAKKSVGKIGIRQGRHDLKRTHLHHATCASCSIFYIHFCKFVINDMIKIADFIKANDFEFQRLLRILHILVKNRIIDFQYLKSKHKIYILSKNVLMRICKPHSGKQFFISKCFSYLIFCLFLNFNHIF